jgi:hypothetical protein
MLRGGLLWTRHEILNFTKCGEIFTNYHTDSEEGILSTELDI